MDELRRAVELNCGGETVAIPRAEAGAVRDCLLERTILAEQRRLPSFFVVGPPRTGSSWLHEVLRARTVLPSPSKETRFFDNHFPRGLKWYLAHFDKNCGERPVGEVAPTYFASVQARERMALTVPNAKIICVFRHPVDRIVSLYRLKRAYGMIPWDFEQAIDRDPELMETSRYASNLRLWQQSFGADNVLPCLYDDLRTSPQEFLNVVVDFVGAPRFPLSAWHYGRVHDSENMTHPRSYYRTRSATLVADWFKARRLDRVVTAFKKSRLQKLVLGGGPPFPKLSKEVLKKMSETFEPEVEGLEHILQRDLSSWKIRHSA